MNLIGNEELTADDKEQDDTCQDISVGLVQTEGRGNLTGSSVQENNQEAGEGHRKGIELGHPGNHNSGEALAVGDRGRDRVVDASHAKAAP